MLLHSILQVGYLSATDQTCVAYATHVEGRQVKRSFALAWVSSFSLKDAKDTQQTVTGPTPKFHLGKVNFRLNYEKLAFQPSETELKVTQKTTASERTSTKHKTDEATFGTLSRENSQKTLFLVLRKCLYSAERKCNPTLWLQIATL